MRNEKIGANSGSVSSAVSMTGGWYVCAMDVWREWPRRGVSPAAGSLGEDCAEEPVLSWDAFGSGDSGLGPKEGDDGADEDGERGKSPPHWLIKDRTSGGRKGQDHSKHDQSAEMKHNTGKERTSGARHRESSVCGSRILLFPRRCFVSMACRATSGLMQGIAARTQ